MNPELNKLYRAICAAEKDALRIAHEHAAKIGQKPLTGWSQEKHDAYHEKYRAEAYAAAQFLFVRKMQIDPD